MKKFGNILFWVIVIGVFLYAANLLFERYKPPKVAGQLQQNTATAEGAAQNTDRPVAPEIVLNDLNGKTIKLSDYRGKVVFLNFWASWCPPCKGEMPDLDKADKELKKGNDAVLLTVNLTDGVRETVDKAKKYINDNKLSMNVLLDTEGKAADTYGIRSIPTTFIINKEGTLADYRIGPISEKEILDYVDKLK